jgi:hypothetical protein
VWWWWGGGEGIPHTAAEGGHGHVAPVVAATGRVLCVHSSCLRCSQMCQHHSVLLSPQTRGMHGMPSSMLSSSLLRLPGAAETSQHAGTYKQNPP